ncbi:tyrosine-type recombinase/integrase [Enterobacter quasiroggenkampii]|uniref:tyrosine-type DNA invertase n=1 Tax=Enterobacter quasiroggenkampii TaxID=2497436 RepID=UPI0021CE9F98|nr:tyrosine-type DNA invertase [Enterobacter quasiroggenkampii]MCU6388835.1 tyrosine-type recombinase/integrase [Enterobacter quasiroggenkampii]
MKKRKHLTYNEVQNIELAAATRRYAIRDKCLIRLCYIHGFRVSELCGLLISDIDVEEKSIFIRRLKNGLSTIHPLNPYEIELIQLWMNERRSWKHSSSPYLFISQKSDFLSRGYVYGLFRELGRVAELSIAVNPHMLRHACGYALADLGADTRLIQDYLGHKNINHTVLYTASNHRRFRNVWGKPGP